MFKQRGVALFVALIILPMLVVLGLMLLGSSFMDLKMSDARGTLDNSNMRLTSASIEILNNSGSFASESSATIFAKVVVDDTLESASFPEISGVVLATSALLPCARTRDVDLSKYKCRYVDMQLEHGFGREKTDGTQWGVNRLGLGVQQAVLVN